MLFNYAQNPFILFFDHAKKTKMKNNTSTRLVYCQNSGLSTLSHSLQSTQNLEKVVYSGRNQNLLGEGLNSRVLQKVLQN